MRHKAPVLAVNLSPISSPRQAIGLGSPKPPVGSTGHYQVGKGFIPIRVGGVVGCRLVRLTSLEPKWRGGGFVVSLPPTNIAGHHHGTARVVNHRPGPWELGICHGIGDGGRARAGSSESAPGFPAAPVRTRWITDGDFG